MSLYCFMKAKYKRLFPKSMRNAIYVATPVFLKVLRAKVIGLLEKSANHDDIYDEEYYTTTVDRYMAPSCDAIAESIISVFSPSSAVDVGCGSGLLLLSLMKRGISCRGLDYSTAALEICQKRGLEVTKFDLEHDSLPSGFRADIAISTEVSEHLPESCADRFVNILCSISDDVVITAAEPSPSYAGTDHVNEQPNEYWIEKFEARYFKFNRDLTNQWRRDWKIRNVSPFYINGLMVFSKSGESL